MLVYLVIAALAATTSHAYEFPNSFNCAPLNTAPSLVCYIPECTEKIVNHIQQELNAAFSYLYMAAHFDDDRIARPGLAKFMYESASEERQHAIQMLEYLNMRGVVFNQTYSLNTAQNDFFKEISANPTYEYALKKAIDMEVTVTNHIYNIVKACESDYHAADVFTDPILSEQHEGMRKLQGAIRTFKDMADGHGQADANAMAEFLFDQKILADGL
ncbi:Ferritin/DPS protein domain [Trinorchestia longiramus]|nr:Ferritin/DPS protein domain [Trinorchestia longiramus]